MSAPAWLGPSCVCRAEDPAGLGGEHWESCNLCKGLYLLQPQKRPLVAAAAQSLPGSRDHSVPGSRAVGTEHAGPDARWDAHVSGLHNNPGVPEPRIYPCQSTVTMTGRTLILSPSPTGPRGGSLPAVEGLGHAHKLLQARPPEVGMPPSACVLHPGTLHPLDVMEPGMRS